MESRSQVLGLQCTLGWSPNQTSLLFFDYIRNATRWPGTSLLRHWCSWNNMARRRGLPETGPSTLLHALKCTMMNTSRYGGRWCQGLTACSTSVVAFTARYNGDRESDYSVNITGHVVCLVVLPGFDLMPQKHSVLENIPCRRGVDQSTVGTISHYRWQISSCKYQPVVFL